MEQHVYHPYDIRISEDEEIIAIVEPDSYIKEMIENKETCWEVEVDVDYDEDEHEPYLIIILHKDNGRIEIELPYGESWEALSEKGVITIVLLTQFDLDHGDLSDAITISINLDEYIKGYVSGATRMWEAVSEEVEGENE
ncbi:MAG: MmgE/PrpD family protein [Aquificae bacterium]|nr:MmgE/PrpD family protein [Aquificota bacterium]